MPRCHVSLRSFSLSPFSSLLRQARRRLGRRPRLAPEVFSSAAGRLAQRKRTEEKRREEKSERERREGD
jgi:hypothetical protein